MWWMQLLYDISHLVEDQVFLGRPLEIEPGVNYDGCSDFLITKFFNFIRETGCIIAFQYPASHPYIHCRYCWGILCRLFSLWCMQSMSYYEWSLSLIAHGVWSHFSIHSCSDEKCSTCRSMFPRTVCPSNCFQSKSHYIISKQIWDGLTMAVQVICELK